MSAILKVYTDSAHTSEVAHTTIYSTTLTQAVVQGATVFQVGAGANWPAQGFIDIVDGVGGNETIAYYGLVNNSANVANTGGFAHAHAASAGALQWAYNLPVGDQVNGIVNDGTQSTPTVQNVTTWYLYNGGDQTAQSPNLSTSSTSSSTQGFADSLVSCLNGSQSFTSSYSMANIVSGTSQEFWVAAEVPNGQSAAGNSQFCTINYTYQSI